MANKEGNIVIKGARVNNLKNITLEIPRDKFVVITGVSGSGKSSLAFDTLFAEGQRRFAESLSSYARQFLGRMSKPDVDLIDGIPPAIAIEQRVNTKNPRSTIATTTEIYDFLRLLFARIGKTYSPISGKEVKIQTANDVISFIKSLKEKASIYILADINWKDRDDKVELMLSLKEQGYSRFFSDKQIPIEDVMQKSASGEFPTELYLLVDRLRFSGEISEELQTRLHSSINSAFEVGKSKLILAYQYADCDTWEYEHFSSEFELDGMVFQKPEEYLFSFNSPLGACPVCGGLGKIIGISEDLVVPDKSLSLYDEAIACWRGEKMSWFKNQLIQNASKNNIRIFEPYCNLSKEEKQKVWDGCPAETEEESIIGINEFFKWVEQNRYKIQYKYLLTRYSGKTVCHECGGSRLRKEAMYVKIGGKNIHEILCMNIEEAQDFISNLELDEHDRGIASKALEEISSRLKYISDVGLSYLRLDRASNTLSGGESQRINLVTALGSSLVGSLYILDEPSIGLHPRDTERLIKVLKNLRDIGNTVVVVEHDENIMKAADVLIDMGPKAGVHGGEIIFQGKVDDKKIQKNESLTLQYLSGSRERYKRKRRTPNYSFTIHGAMQNNLKDIDVTFPLSCLTVVTGVSGSGKSSLVGDILYPAIYRAINHAGAAPGTFRSLSGNIDRISRIEYVDQNPIGKSSRSNAVTYLKIYDDIRKLFSEQAYAKMNGYTPSFFSFNQEGGRCPECQGEGFVKIGMQFMADVKMVCDSCGGKRFKPDILEVRYKEKNIDDILNMSVAEAIEFFAAQKESSAERIVEKLQALVDVGLSYIKLGQSSSTLSGGESQRIKLAYFISLEEKNDKKILFLFDEPTTGLHFYDVEKLLKSFDLLLSRGHSIIVVEHNTDVIRSADWIIDLGPEAGDKGGNLVFQGSFDNLLKCKNSLTAKFCKP